MIRRNKDSKFIIYQVLYIFVISLLAIKGANLDLSRVVNKNNVVERSVRDSLTTLIDSMNAKGIKFNINIVDEKIENKELQLKLASLNHQLATITEKVREQPVEVTPPPVEEKVQEQTILQSPLAVDQIFIQDTWNKTKNTGSVPVSIVDPANQNTIAVIPPGTEKVFDLQEQKEIVIKYGSQQQSAKVIPNRPPEIRVAKATTKMDANEAYVQELQRVTCFTVTVSDERIDQIKVSYTGPITVTKPVKDNKGNLVYQVSLNLAPTSQRFEDWLERNRGMRNPDGKYKVPFFFTAIDEKAKHKIQAGDNFYFTDFSK